MSDLKSFDPDVFKSQVRTWKKVRMKKTLSCHPVPAGFEKFKKQLNDDVFEVLGFKDAITIKTCFCGKTPHSADCITWPHLTVSILDLDDQETCVHSLWLEPVECEAMDNLEIFQPKDVELPMVTDKVAIDESAKEPKKSFYVLEITTEGILLVDTEKYENPDFIVDFESGKWMLGDEDYFSGEVVKTSENSAITILLGEVEFLKSLGFAYLEKFKRERKKETEKILLEAFEKIQNI